MTKLSDQERIVRMETLLETFYKEFQDFRKEVRMNTEAFVTHDKHKDDMADLQKSIKRLSTEIEKIEKKRWVQNTLSAILGAILTFLITSFIANIGN